MHGFIVMRGVIGNLKSQHPGMWPRPAKTQEALPQARTHATSGRPA